MKSTRVGTVVLGWLVLVASAIGDGHMTDLLGLCKVRLKSGKGIEGVVVVAGGGDNRLWEPNGFYQFIDSTREKVSLFDCSFSTFMPENGLVTETLWPGGKNQPDVYSYQVRTRYIQGGRGYYKTTTKVSKADDTTSVLSRDITHHRTFELLDYVPVCRTLPPGLRRYGRAWSDALLKIPLSDIAEFSLERNPSVEWLHRIAVAESAFAIENADDPDYAGPPNWYHKVCSDGSYRDLFRPWQY